jgi:predicted dienelactone hydrolase
MELFMSAPRILNPMIFVVMAAGVFGCELPPTDGPVDAPDQLGPLLVGHTQMTAIDETRGDRSILVDIWYPVDAGDEEGSQRTEYELIPYVGLESDVAFEDVPVSARRGRTLIVFSHGYGGINTQSVGLVEALASHGFVVASPEHTGNAQSSFTDTFDEAAANRVPDVSFVIDRMLARSREPADAFAGRLDEERVGVVGHSFGGMTAIGVVSGWAGAPPDPRVAAIAPISAVIDGDLQSDERESSNAGFTPEQLASVDVPVMLIGGTEDVDVPIENNDIAFDQMVNAPVVYMVDVIDANHTHFANVCAIGDMLIDLGSDIDSWPIFGAEELIEPYQATCSEDAFPIEEATRLQRLYVTSFFRRHLLGETGYDYFLTPSHADSEPSITFQIRD